MTRSKMLGISSYISKHTQKTHNCFFAEDDKVLPFSPDREGELCLVNLDMEEEAKDGAIGEIEGGGGGRVNDPL